MGCCHASNYTILCDTHGTIVSVSDPLLKRLQYDSAILEGQFIGILMSEFMSMMHKKFFIGRFAAAKGVERNYLENKLKALHYKRPLLIYDIGGRAAPVSLSIIPKQDRLSLTFEFITESSDLYYTKIPLTVDGVFKENKSDVVIICMDFVDSTGNLLLSGAPASIFINIQFHKSVIDLIRNKYYPFIYLHEVIGDSFIVALNADWTYTSHLFCATLAVVFIEDLVKATRHFVSIRAGVAYGKIHYGTIGSTFRFFGFPMNMSSRLENKCNPHEINICNKLYSKLVEEQRYLQYTLSVPQKRTALLKGFGETEYYALALNDTSPCVTYN